MRNVLFVLGILVMLTGFRSKSVEDATANKKKQEVVKTYLLMKDNFVVSDSINASLNALQLSKELTKVKIGKANKEKEAVKKALDESVTIAKQIAATRNINKQRNLFATLSEKMWFLLKEQPGASKKTLYKQVCPMTGVSWISDEQAIKNPYYPKNMLTCGEVKDSLK